MRLLLDENLSFRLVRDLADMYPGCAHVRDLGLRGSTDEQIWGRAAKDGYLLTSKDTDFYQRSLVFGSPPKVIWLRIGNVPTHAITTLLRQRYVIVRRFYEDPRASFLPLGSA